MISFALSAMAKPDAKSKSAKKSEFVEIAAEGGQHVEPPPPALLEPDPELTPEEAEQVRKDYLLTRFWISARGFWGKGGDRLAWIFSIGLLILIVTNVGFQYGINVWNRAVFDAIEKRDSAGVLYLTGVFFRSRSAACCSAWRRSSRAWASSAAGAPG
jgi:putative ATP-binding cassette transporter